MWWRVHRVRSRLIVRWIRIFCRRMKTFVWITVTLLVHTPSLPVRIRSRTPASSTLGANHPETTQQRVNTSDGETWWREEWEERKEDGVKQKGSGWRKGGELKAVESGTTLCSYTLLRPALPPPQHPHLHPCSSHSTPAPFGPSWNADFHPHPPPVCFSLLLLLQKRET